MHIKKAGVHMQSINTAGVKRIVQMWFIIPITQYQRVYDIVLWLYGTYIRYLYNNPSLVIPPLSINYNAFAQQMLRYVKNNTIN